MGVKGRVNVLELVTKGKIIRDHDTWMVRLKWGKQFSNENLRRTKQTFLSHLEESSPV